MEKGNLKRGEKVLIHSAAGGVGLAAIEIAKEIGAEIYATAGTQEKRTFLEKNGVKGAFDSRSLEFAEKIEKMTQGYGVDVVLNASTGEAFIKSLELVAPYGRFIEIGVREIIDNRPLGMGIFKKGASFIPVSISPIMPNYDNALQEIAAHFAKRDWESLPLTSYPYQDVQAAFKLLSSGKQIGKVIILHKDPRQLKELNRKYSDEIDRYKYTITNNEGMTSLVQAAELACSQDSIHTEVYVTKKNSIAKGDVSLSQIATTLTHLINKRNRPALGTSFVPPLIKWKTLLYKFLEEFLGIDGIGVNDNFSDLGITSLDVVQLKS